MDLTTALKLPISIWSAFRIRRVVNVIIQQVYQSSGRPVDGSYRIKLKWFPVGFELVGGTNETLEIFNACMRIIKVSKDTFANFQ